MPLPPTPTNQKMSAFPSTPNTFPVNSDTSKSTTTFRPRLTVTTPLTVASTVTMVEVMVKATEVTVKATEVDVMAKATEAIVMMKAMATTRTMIMTMIAAMATNMKKTTKKITVNKNIINDFLINYSFKDFYDCLNKTSEILLLLFQRRRLFHLFGMVWLNFVLFGTISSSLGS